MRQSGLWRPANNRDLVLSKSIDGTYVSGVHSEVGTCQQLMERPSAGDDKDLASALAQFAVVLFRLTADEYRKMGLSIAIKVKT